MLKTQQILRGTYGELIFAGNNPLIDAGRQLLKEAIAKGYIDEPYVDVDKKHRGSALNYDLYDVDRNEVLVQRRYTVCTKYGNSPTKSYLVIRRHGKNIQVLRVIEDAKPLVVKRSRASVDFGEVLEVLHRKSEVVTPPVKCLMVVEVMQHDRLQTLDHALPLFRTKDSSTESDGQTWFKIFCTRDRIDQEIRNAQKCLDALRDGKRLAIIEVTPKGRVFRQTDPLRFLVSSVRYVRQIELIQPATPVTGQVEA